MVKKMETTIIVPLKWIEYGVIQGLYRDNGKDNGNYYIMGYLGFRV